MALPNCTAIDNCWMRQAAAYFSSVWCLKFLPNSSTKSNDRGPGTPEDSIATEVYSCVYMCEFMCVIHAVGRFLAKMAATYAFGMLDFQNSFNPIHRDKMLETNCDLTSDIDPFVHSSYSSPSHLQSGDRSMSFQSRVYIRVNLWGLCFSV